MKTIELLLFEDSPNYRESLSMLIRHEPGLFLAEAFPHAEGLEKALERHNPEVVLMDIDMGAGRNGIQACEIIRAKLPNCQVVIFTVFDDDERVFAAIQAGANGYLLKNTPPQEIVRAIREIHEGGSPMTAGIARRVMEYFRKRPAAAPPAPKMGEKSPEMDVLTEREIEMLEAISKGYRNKEIAAKFFLAEDTVRSHCRNIYKKLQVNSRVEALSKLNWSFKK